jgi:circadian clock protein KaiC
LPALAQATLRRGSLLVAGPSGSGKTIMASQFLAEGLKQGEPGIVAIFEELPADLLDRAAKIGIDFEKPQKDGTLSELPARMRE